MPSQEVPQRWNEAWMWAFVSVSFTFPRVFFSLLVMALNHDMTQPWEHSRENFLGPSFIMLDGTWIYKSVIPVHHSGVVPEYQCAVKREAKKAQKDKDRPNSTTSCSPEGPPPPSEKVPSFNRPSALPSDGSSRLVRFFMESMSQKAVFLFCELHRQLANNIESWLAPDGDSFSTGSP